MAGGNEPGRSANCNPITSAKTDMAVRVLCRLLCRIERRPPRLDLAGYPYLPRARVATTAAASYLSLLDRGTP